MSEVLQLLPEGAAGLKAKTGLYEAIKKGLEEIDLNCRPERESGEP